MRDDTCPCKSLSALLRDEQNYFSFQDFEVGYKGEVNALFPHILYGRALIS